MSTQHTPGPWVINPIQLNQIATADATLAIARATVLADHGETIANARLIAEAPALLMLANLYALDFTDERQARAEFGDASVDRELQRRAIVAKATGK